MNVDITAITDEVVADLTTELSDDAEFSADILRIKVKSVVRELIQKREYKNTSWSDEEIANDLNNYYGTIMNVARYDYNMRGAEGEENHNENGINRGFVDRDSLWKGVHAFVGVLK